MSTGKFLHGHNNKGKNFIRTEEQRRNLSESHKSFWTQERREEKRQVTKTLWAKGVYGNSTRHSKEEYQLKSILEELGFKSTIDTTKFITYNGRTREPDFYNLQTREIIEVFGSYHHRDQKGKVHETPEEIIDWYSKVNYSCRIIWDYEIKDWRK